MVKKTQNSNCDNTQKFKFLKLKTEIVMKLKNSNCDKDEKLKCDETEQIKL